MGDTLTEDDLQSEEYKKLERIKKEREKAEKAIEEEEKREGKVNLAYLDPASTARLKGFGRGSEDIRKSLERLTGFMTATGIGGLFLSIVAKSVDISGLGMAGATMFSFIGGLADGMVIVSLFMAIFILVMALINRKKFKAEIKPIIGASIVMLIILIAYEVYRFLSVPIL